MTGTAYLPVNSENSTGLSTTENPCALSSSAQNARDFASDLLPANLGPAAIVFNSSRACGASSASSPTRVISSRVRHAHQLFHFSHRLARNRSRTRGTVAEYLSELVCLRANFDSSFSNRTKFCFHRFEQHFLAIDAPPTGSAALNCDVLDCRDRTERLVQVIDVADFGCSGISSPNTLRIGDCGSQFFPDILRIFEQSNCVA